MFNLLKRLFKKKELTNLERFSLILNSEIDFKILYNEHCDFLYRNIKIYIQELENILKQDILKDTLVFTKVSQDRMIRLTFLEFLGDDGRIPLHPTEDIRKLTKLVIELMEKFELYKDLKSDSTLTYNLRMLQLHILYIETIIETIYNSLKK